MFGPGVGFECQEQNGLHIWSDNFLVEVLDDNGEQVSEGEKGELILTSINKEGFCNIRYRTGDIVKLLSPNATAAGQLLKYHASSAEPMTC